MDGGLAVRTVRLARVFMAYSCCVWGETSIRDEAMRLATTIQSIQERLKEDKALIKLKLGIPSVESSCLSVLALRRDPGFEEVVHNILALQNRDGSWPAIAADKPQGCWVTALAILCLLATDNEVPRLHNAVRWLLGAKGKEAQWIWRWKFRMIDTAVRFDPAKYGWNWISGTTSWVIPTAFSLIALQKVRRRSLFGGAELAERVETGTAMLFDRMCPGGGWNAGNGVAFGVPCFPYIDATAIALLALRGRENEAGTQDSLTWLANHLLSCPSPYSLAWGIIALAAYHRQDVADDLVNHAAARLTSLIEKAWPADVCTLAVCALALDAVDGDNVFEV